MNIQLVNINSLKPYPGNPRKWSEEATKNLTQSIKRFGFLDPVICNIAPSRKNIVLGGNFRLKVAKDIGITEIPVVFVNISDSKREAELNLRLNKNQGEFDLELLADFDKKILADVGFSSEELDDIFDVDVDALLVPGNQPVDRRRKFLVSGNYRHQLANIEGAANGEITTNYIKQKRR